MFSVLTGLGIAGWSGLAVIIVLLAAIAAWQHARARQRQDEAEAEAREAQRPASRPARSGPASTAAAATATATARDMPTAPRAVPSPAQATQYLDNGKPGDDAQVSAWEAYKAEIDRRTEAFAKARGSVVIRIVHHDVDEYVDTDTAINAIDTIRKAAANAPIDVVLHTPGGIASATQQILHALRRHKGRKTAFVPYRAKSAGTMIALACDEIIMGSSAVLGPIDPQYAWMPAPILAALTEQKSADRISDEMLILSRMAEQAVNEARRFSCDYINDAHKQDGTCSLTNDLIGGGRNHDYPILPEEAAGFGLNISTALPEAAYGICQPPPKNDPVLIVSMFNTQKEKDGAAPSRPVFR